MPRTRHPAINCQAILGESLREGEHVQVQRACVSRPPVRDENLAGPAGKRVDLHAAVRYMLGISRRVPEDQGGGHTVAGRTMIADG